MDKFQAYVTSPVEYWRRHPQGEYLLERGGRETLAPIYANLTLTNRCNLRCTICPSQQGLETTGSSRSEMPVEMFRRIAASVFPLLLAVELNSAGEPLSYTHIAEVLESITAHDCSLILQTNGTLFTKRNVEMLARCKGRVSLSIDAVGPLFNELRVNGKWEDVDHGTRAFMARRDAGTLDVIATPAVTERSLDGMLDVFQWSNDVGLDMVHFQPYTPIQGGREEVPSAAGMRYQANRIVEWCKRTGARTRLGMSNQLLYAPPGKMGLPSRVPYNFFPLEPGHPLADRHFLCNAPTNALDIGVDGEVGPCCAGQGIPLGWIDSIEGFADLWFGANMAKIRRSLLRGAEGFLPHPICAACITRNAPQCLDGRRSLDYAQAALPDEALVCELAVVPLSWFRRSLITEYPFLARIPPGLDPRLYRLFEDETRLGADAFQARGLDLHFATSDGADPVKNGRRYTLRRIA